MAVLLQLFGYAAVLATVPHGEYASLVEPLRRLPVEVLLPFGVLALPALMLALLFGELSFLVGIQPTNVLVVVSSYIVGVVSVWIVTLVKVYATDSSP